MMCPDVDITYHWTTAALYKLQTPRLLQKWGSVFVNELFPSHCLLKLCTQCSCPAPSSSPAALPWHGAHGAVPRTISRIPTAGDVQDRRLDCGYDLWSWFITWAPQFTPWVSTSNLPPVLSYGEYTGGKILNTIHPTLGKFSRSCLSDFEFF